MDCKSLSVLSLLLLLAFLLMTSGSVTPCVYHQEFNCSSNQSIELSVNEDFSCIEWNGAAADKCFLFIKTRRDDGIVNFVLSDSNIDGDLTIGYGEDSDNISTTRHTVTNSTGWGENGIIYDSQSIWIAWSTTVDGKIKAQFQDLIFKQFPVTLHKEDNGTFRFPNSSCNYTYRPNSAFIWMLSRDDPCNETCNETSMNITVKAVSPIKSGDALILGMGNKTQMFHGPKSLLLPENLTEPLNIALTLGEAFVILLTGRSFTESDIEFEINWKRNSTKPKNATVQSTTPMSEAWLESVSVCIDGLSKEEFSQNETEFKDIVAEIGTKFAGNEKKVVTSHKIRRENVVIIDTLGRNGSERVQIILTIMDHYEKMKPEFRAERLQEMFRKEIYKEDLSNAGFKIVSCRTTPDYTDWFWASCIAFIFSIGILLIMWYIKSKRFGENEGHDDHENLIIKDKKQRTVGNEYEHGYYTTMESLQNLAKARVNENSVAHSELNAEDHTVTRKTKVEKHHSDVGARRNPAKFNHIRPTSDPIRLQELKNDRSACMESPKSILRKVVKADVLNNAPITEEPQENVQEHLYDTVRSQKVLIISEAESTEPEHYVNAVSIEDEDETEDTRC